jgi:hypothetical protein
VHVSLLASAAVPTARLTAYAVANPNVVRLNDAATCDFRGVSRSAGWDFRPRVESDRPFLPSVEQ